MPISSASEVEHPQVRVPRCVCRDGSNGRWRPSQFTNEPAFSTTGATGNTTSARSVTALCRSSRLTTNGAASSAASAAGGVGQVGDLHAADQQGAESRRPRRPRGWPRCHGRAPPAVRRRSTRRGLGARRASATGRPPGSRCGQRAGFQRAALTGPARNPGQPGAGGVGETHRGRQRAGRRRQPLADQDHRTRQARAASLTSARPSSAPASPPGAVRISVPDILCRPRVANGATAAPAGRVLRAALRSRRKTIGDSSSGSKPGQQDGRRLLQVGVGDRHRLAGDTGGQEVGLLGAVRPGPEVDVVGAQHDPGELARRRRRPRRSAGRRPGPRPGPRGRAAPARPCRAPPTTTPDAARRPRRGPAGW